MNTANRSNYSKTMYNVNTLFRTAIILAISCSAASANLIVDGGFESPNAGPGGLNSGTLNFSPGQTIDGVWSVFGSGGNVSIYPKTETGPGGVTYTVEEGTQALDLTGTLDNGASVGVEEQIATTPGKLYSLTFYLGDINNSGYPFSGAATVGVEINGTAFQTASSASSSGLNVTFKQFKYLFTAPGSTTTIGFLNESAGNVGINAVDNVSVNLASATVTPEPAPGFLILVGFAALLWVNRKYGRLIVEKRLQPKGER